jgi:hypothetical protein
MGCPAQVELGQTLVFSVCTHDPDTGVLTDAAAVPPYRVYEAETAVPILTGDMAKLDDVNTTGFYTEAIACTTANGFEDKKSYTVYIEATVDGETGGIAYGFNVFSLDSIADALLKRDMSAVTGEAARSPLNALRFLRNKWTIVGAALSVKKEDDAAEAWASTLTTDAAADPITSSDPA